MPTNYELREPHGGVPIKTWTKGVPVEPEAVDQLTNIARLPIVHKWVAAMPDVHLGIGATVGSVIPTVGAVIPAAVGVDIGCGMMAVETTLKASDLPDNLGPMRNTIERAVPHGRGRSGRRGDKGSWSDVPNRVGKVWKDLEAGFKAIVDKHPGVEKSNNVVHLGTLGTGNHFIEVCLDEKDHVWFMLHSGSRGVGNRIGSHFIALAVATDVRGSQFHRFHRYPGSHSVVSRRSGALRHCREPGVARRAGTVMGTSTAEGGG